MRRLANAGILFGAAVVVCGIGWLISMGFYAIGLWPLGALTRVGVWLFAIFCLYWIVKHLFIGEDQMMMNDIEKMRRTRDD